MRLSEAIRLGSMLRPQAFGTYERNGAVCALGGAILAMGGADLSEVEYLAQFFPRVIDQRRRFNCPACGDRDCAGIMIAHLNDYHRWTREQIADWVETIEPQDVGPAVEVAAQAEGA